MGGMGLVLTSKGGKVTSPRAPYEVPKMSVKVLQAFFYSHSTNCKV